MENNFKRKLMAFWLFLWVGIPFMLAQSPMMISGRITDDLGFMNKELGRQAGAVFARILRAIKKKDFKEAQRVITGGKSR